MVIGAIKKTKTETKAHPNPILSPYMHFGDKLKYLCYFTYISKPIYI
jgi:hypothetical protein